MKIILNEDVYNLGEEGDVCVVADGYARNYLIPQGLAVLCNKQSLSMFEHKKEAIEKRKEEKRKEALGLKEKLEGLTLTIKMPAGETGKLFGSVTNAVIADALEKEGVTVEKKKIDVPTSNIKMIGKYTVLVKLYSGELAKIEIIVESVDGKAEAALAKKQEAMAAKAARKEAASGAEETVDAEEAEASEEVEAEDEVEAETEDDSADSDEE